MFEFLETLEPLHKMFWYVALFSSAVFLIQSLLTFIGGADMDGVEADFDSNLEDVSAPFQLFSLRNFVNFLLGFGWGGVMLYPKFESTTMIIVIATLIGLVFVVIFIVLIKQILKLTEDNTFKLEEVIGMTGQVYIPIPESLSGKGKVQISVKGAHHEIDAMTEESEKISSTTMVRIESIKDNILIVTKLN